MLNRTSTTIIFGMLALSVNLADATVKMVDQSKSCGFDNSSGTSSCEKEAVIINKHGGCGSSSSCGPGHNNATHPDNTNDIKNSGIKGMQSQSVPMAR